MDTWDTLRDKALAALKDDNSEEAVQLLSDAISLSSANHDLHFLRGTAYVKLEQWKEAVEDLEKVVELKPAFEKGHARLAVARFGSKDFIGARRSYQNALNLDPGNEEYQKAMVACKDATDKAAGDNAAETAIPELVQKLNDPKQIAKLKEHKTTGAYFKDPEFLDMLTAIQANPTTVQKFLTDPRMLQCIGVILDMPLVDTLANTQMKREQFTISSDEESESEAESDSEEEEDEARAANLPQPLSKTKAAPKQDTTGQPAVYQDGLLKGLPIQGSEPAAPGIHRIDANSPADELRRGVAAKLGMTVDQMDRMSRFAHTGSFESKGPAAEAEAAASSGADDGSAPAPVAEPATQPTAATTDSAPAPAPKALEPVVQVIDDDPAEVFLPDTVPEDAAERSMLAAATKVEATEHYTDRKFRCALKLYGFGHMLDPTNMVYKLNMAAAYLELEQFAECLECCDEAIAVGDTADAEAKLLGKAHFRRGRALSGLEKFDDAIKAFKMALEKNRCAEYLKAKNECLKAHERYLADREYDPLKAQGCKARGNDLYQKGDFPEAVAEYERAIRHDPKNTGLLSKVYCNRAACYTKMGEMTLAIQDSDRCISADPKFIKGYLRKGRILLITEQWTDAVKVYTIALELDPHNYDARTGLDKAKTGNVLLSKTAASRAEEAMQNKEIRQIWEEFRWLLELMTKDPESRKVKKELEDPLVRSKLAKLRAAGLM